MQKKIYFYSTLVILFMAYSCSGKSNKKPKDPETDTIVKNDQDTSKPANDTSWINQIQFGYSNEQGHLILVDSVIEPLSPKALIYSLDSAGNKMTVTYNSYQFKGKNDTGRQIYFNFSDAPGYLYSSESKVDQQQTVVLFTEEFLTKRTVIPYTRPDKKGIPDNVKKKIETDKSRKIKNSSEIATLQNAGNVYLMEFARKKDSALASLVLVYNDQYTYYDFPAMYDQQSTWRVDDGGEFWLDGIEIIAAFKNGETIEIVFDWIGAEGYNTQYLKQVDGIFKEIKTNYRYTAPI